MQISIIYFSKTGKTKEMAQVIANGAVTEKDVDAKIFPIENVDIDFLQNSNAVIFGTPTYYANDVWQMQKWLDECDKKLLCGKLGAVFATADFAQGGADIAIQTILGHLLVDGMLVYSGGSAEGKPYIHLGAVALKENFEQSKPMFEIFGKRIAKKAKELF
ncbi:MAG: flavodoxin domain-containing protein [Oscillospiraceae bacterium]